MDEERIIEYTPISSSHKKVLDLIMIEKTNAKDCIIPDIIPVIRFGRRVGIWNKVRTRG